MESWACADTSPPIKNKSSANFFMLNLGFNSILPCFKKAISFHDSTNKERKLKSKILVQCNKRLFDVINGTTASLY